MHSRDSQAVRLAAEAADRIIGYYPKLNATDPKLFTAALVELLSTCPPHVLNRATNPVHGVHTQLEFLNLASLSQLLEKWKTEFFQKEEMRARYANWGKNQTPAPQITPPKERPTLEQLKAKYGQNWGLGEGKLNETPEQINDRWHAQVKPWGEIVEHYKNAPGRISWLANRHPVLRGETEDAPEIK